LGLAKWSRQIVPTNPSIFVSMSAAATLPSTLFGQSLAPKRRRVQGRPRVGVSQLNVYKGRTAGPQRLHREQPELAGDRAFGVTKHSHSAKRSAVQFMTFLKLSVANFSLSAAPPCFPLEISIAGRESGR
jgi:hypothetical protein